MNTLVDYEFYYEALPIHETARSAVERYNERHEKPANMIWVCWSDYMELVVREKNGVGVGWNPCGREKGNVMVGRVE